MLKVAGDGIEDIFSKTDFCSHVLGEPSLQFDDKNSQYAKGGGRSKAILSYQFLNKVRNKKIKLADLEASTKANIKQLVREIVSRLEEKK